VRSKPKEMPMLEPLSSSATPRAPAIGCVVLIQAALAFSASACDYLTLRDAAFDERRDLHALCVIGRSETDIAARQIYDRLAEWLELSAAGINLEPLYLSGDDPDTRWEEFGMPSAPGSMPVVALVGRRAMPRRSWVMDHWEPAPTDEDLAHLKTSTAREAMRGLLGRKLAVLLYIPGTGPSAGAAEGTLDAAVQAWENKKEEWLGLSVVQVDRADQRERLLLKFTGVKPAGPDWVAVVFGRGKFMPPLEGDAITEARLNEQLEQLIEACTCMRPPASMGVDIPMIWTQALDDTVVRLQTEEDVSAVPAEADVLPPTATTESAPEGPIVARILWTFGGLLAVVLLVTAALLWRRPRPA
jgi:hypothetical protein